MNYGAEVANVFHFSTGAAGYLQTFRQLPNANDQFITLRNSLSEQAKDFDIDRRLVERFLSNPEQEWNALFEEVLSRDSKDHWSDILEVKLGVGGIKLDLKKATSLISNWLKKKNS